MFTTSVADSEGVRQLCNQALSHLGITTPITTLVDSSRESDSCTRFLSMSLDDVLQEFNWPFAKVVESLDKMPQTVLTWDYLYTYPSSAVNVWAVFDEGTTDTRFHQDFEVVYLEGTTKAIASNNNTAYAEYTKRVVDPSIWSSKFVKSVSYYLAAQMAPQLAGDKGKADELMGTYKILIEETKGVTNSQKPKQPKQKQGYVDIR